MMINQGINVTEHKINDVSSIKSKKMAKNKFLTMNDELNDSWLLIFDHDWWTKFFV